MTYLEDSDRFQIRMGSLEEAIGKENSVRFFDAFVEHLDLSKTGFAISAIKIEG